MRLNHLDSALIPDGLEIARLYSTAGHRQPIAYAACQRSAPMQTREHFLAPAGVGRQSMGSIKAQDMIGPR